MTIRYKPSFLKEMGKLPHALREEAKEKIELFAQDPKHPSLKAHKLKGKLQGFWSFSVNYKHRIIYARESKSVIVLLHIGDHSIYQ